MEPTTVVNIFMCQNALQLPVAFYGIINWQPFIAHWWTARDCFGMDLSLTLLTATVNTCWNQCGIFGLCFAIYKHVCLQTQHARCIILSNVILVFPNAPKCICFWFIRLVSIRSSCMKCSLPFRTLFSHLYLTSVPYAHTILCIHSRIFSHYTINKYIYIYR